MVASIREIDNYKQTPNTMDTARLAALVQFSKICIDYNSPIATSNNQVSICGDPIIIRLLSEQLDPKQRTLLHLNELISRALCLEV